LYRFVSGINFTRSNSKTAPPPQMRAHTTSYGTNLKKNNPLVVINVVTKWRLDDVISKTLSK